MAANHLLLTAARNGDVAAMEAALQAGAEIECRDSYGNTPLMKAASGGHAEATKLLLAHGADVMGCSDQHGQSVLCRATDSQAANILQVILDAIPCDIREAEIEKALAVAAYNNKPTACEWLLGALAPIKRQAQAQKILFTAAQYGHCKLADIALQAGANLEHVQENGLTPLAVAALGQQAKMVGKLLRLGASPYLPDDDKTSIHSLVATSVFAAGEILARLEAAEQCPTATPKRKKPNPSTTIRPSLG